MRILLDTHTFLWFSSDSNKLSAKAKELVLDPQNEKLLSVVVGWEIAIKHSIGKLELNAPVFALLNGPTQRPDWTLLGLNLLHISEVASLPLHHRDPFDRMLVAQSLLGEASIVSCDEHLDAYGVDRIW